MRNERQPWEAEIDSRFFALFGALRSDAGVSLTFNCQNEDEDKNGQPLEAIDYTAECTDWKPKRFVGNTINKALEAAFQFLQEHDKRKMEKKATDLIDSPSSKPSEQTAVKGAEPPTTSQSIDDELAAASFFVHFRRALNPEYRDLVLLRMRTHEIELFYPSLLNRYLSMIFLKQCLDPIDVAQHLAEDFNERIRNAHVQRDRKHESIQTIDDIKKQ